MKAYPYLYETHLHTAQGSACAHNSGYEMAKALHEAGYAGMFVTDHNWGGNTRVDRNQSWESWVREFETGYLDACRYGQEHPDFDVFFGYEAGFHGTEFLIYGISPEWLIANPQIREASLEAHLTMVRKAGGFVIHAHPYREEWYIPEIRLFPELVDGVEGVNATHSSSKSNSHNHAEYDQRAIAYAGEHGLPMSAGSDIHSVNLYGGGVRVDHRLTSVKDFCDTIRSGKGYLLTNGDADFLPNGEKV